MSLRGRRLRAASLAAALAAGLTAWAQDTPDSRLRFEVASLKDHPGPGGAVPVMRGGPGTDDPGHLYYTNVPLLSILGTAFQVKLNRLKGPVWIRTERYDITANLPPETTSRQLAVMLRNLLMERMGMTAHREAKEEPVYELLLDQDGPKLKPAEPADASALSAGFRVGRDGFPEIPAGRNQIVRLAQPAGTRMAGRMQTMGDLAVALEGIAGRPVVDKTGLTEKYDFKLAYSMGLSAASPGAAPPSADSAPNIFDAVRQYLGLKLQPGRGTIEYVIIDSVNKIPSEE